mgnify:FL=1|jgi:hypothetical protein
MPMTPKEMVRLLKKNGFIHIKSNNGSHQKYHHPGRNITLSVPMHAKELKKGIEQQLLKEAGLKPSQNGGKS